MPHLSTIWTITVVSKFESMLTILGPQKLALRLMEISCRWKWCMRDGYKVVMIDWGDPSSSSWTFSSLSYFIFKRRRALTPPSHPGWSMWCFSRGRWGDVLIHSPASHPLLISILTSSASSSLPRAWHGCKRQLLHCKKFVSSQSKHLKGWRDPRGGVTVLSHKGPWRDPCG